jgi:anthranilate synthase component II
VATTAPLRLTVIDNYDSFTFNLVDLFEQLGAFCSVYRNDAVSLDLLAGSEADAFLVSPGPCTPADSGVSLPLFEAALAGRERRPILGVCLGHQALAQAAGGHVVKATPVHGRTSIIDHDGLGLFSGLPQGFAATRYNSLVVDDRSLSAELEVTARARDDGHVMGLRHRSLPLETVQFHPESHLSEHGPAMLGAFLRLVHARTRVE